MSDRPLVILTALDLEYAAIRDLMTGLTPHWHLHGTRFELGRFEGGSGQVALALVGKGNQTAAALTERALHEFDPTAVVFVGVAGALRSDIRLGDVVVASHVYAYHGATSMDDGVKTRPRVWETSHLTDQLAHHVARSGTWARTLPGSPKVHFGPLAAGEVVLNSTTSPEARLLDRHFNDAVAIEMEAAGVAQAAHLSSATPMAVVRGISDRADGSKETTDAEQWQPRAVANAAAFAAALAEEISSRAGETSHLTRSPEMSQHAQFSNSDNVRVGVQAGQVFGGISFGPNARPHVDLIDELAALRLMLDEAHAARRLDDVTFEAARAELDDANKSSGNPTPERTGRLLLALKKLLGLVSDLADVGAKVAALITAVKGRS